MNIQSGRYVLSVSAQARRILRVFGGAVSVLAEEPSQNRGPWSQPWRAVEHHLECQLRTPGLLDRYAPR